MARTLRLVLGLTALAALPVGAQERPALTVLFLHGSVVTGPPGQESLFALRSFLPDERLQDVLASEKVSWTASNFSTQLSWDYLRQFNVIVLLDFPMVEKHQNASEAIRAAEALLDRHVKEGGGLLAMGITEYGMWGLERGTEELDRLLQPYGAKVLSEQVLEKDKGLIVPSLGGGAMGWTGNVVAHEVTQGVRGLLYPVDYAWAYYTHPLRVGPDWQVVLKGSPSAGSFTSVLGRGGASGELAERTPGTYSAEPPLLAVRPLGAGRIALWPTIPSPYLVDAYHPFWGGGLTMEGTQADKPSDGRRLLLNLLKWLGAPSQGKLGGAALPPLNAGIGDEVGFQTVNWEAVKLEGKSIPSLYRGLIGLQSTLSVGRAEPAELIKTAREAGYDFAAFTEDLARLTAAKLTTLKELCLKASDDRFQVYPGFTYRDQSGNLWTTFGRQLDWPKDEWFVPGQAGVIVKNNLLFRGFQFPPLILTDAGHNPEPPWYQGNFKGMAVYTLRGGEVIDDAAAAYLGLQDRGFDLFPVVVNFAGSPAEVRAAAQAPWQTFVRWWELSDVIGALSGNNAMRQGSYVWHRPAFVSGGPVLEDYRIFNFGTADLAVPQNDRYRVHLSLSSPVGLREVALHDGPNLRRRVLVNGAKEWTGDFEGYQDRNHAYVLQAADTRGGRLVSGVGWTDAQEVGLVRCTDNINTYTSGKFQAVKLHALRGLESYIDRQAGGACFFPFCWLPETERPAVDQQLTSVGRFGYVRDDGLDYTYPTTASANWNQNDQPERAVPQTVWRGRTRQTMFGPRPDGTSVYLVEGDYTVLRDLEIPQARVAVYRTNWIRESNVMLLQPSGAAASCTVLNSRQPYAFGALDGMDYVAQLAPTGGSRAIIPLQTGLLYEAIHNRDAQTTYLGAHVAVPEKKLPAGRRLTYRYLAVWDTVQGRPDNSFIEEVCNTLGLRGRTAYTVTATHGSVLATQFALRLKADGCGFSAVISQAKLPLDLPVFIEGLNDRWPAGVLYHGKNTLFVPTWRMTRVGDRYAERVATPGENQLLRFAVTDGTGMAQVDTEIGEKRVYLGNLLTCERREVFLELEDARPGQAVTMANNPLDEAVTITIRPGPGFDLLGDFAQTVTLPPGGVARVGL